MKRLKDIKFAASACHAIVSRSRKGCFKLPESIAVLDGVARRSYARLEKGCKHGNEEVVQHGDMSLVCIVAGQEVIPVAVNHGSRLETCLKAEGQGFRWSTRTQARIARKIEEALKADIDKVGTTTTEA